MSTEIAEVDKGTQHQMGGMPAVTSTTMAMATTRQAQEVQAAMIVAKQFPRDEIAAMSRIKRSCSRRALAEQAMYAYPRGGQTVTGPSIRLAEMLAQNWGNIDYGVIELEQKQGESTCMAYCWDLETNTRCTKIFSVSHVRHTKTGRTLLTDPRDIYEMVANQGSRRVRACVLQVIPGDVVEMAEQECDKTMKGANDKPLLDRVREMVIAFERFGVSKDMLEARLGHNIDACIEAELVQLRKIYTSLKDGAASREDFFTVSAKSETGSAKSRTESVAGKVKKAQPASFESLQDRCMQVQGLADVKDMRAVVEVSGLETGQINTLLTLLDQAEDQFKLGSGKE